MLVIATKTAFAQNQPVQTQEKKTHKGRFFLSYGWNRAWYTKSDIHMTGIGYNITLYDVVAKDRPEHFKIETYFNPAKLSIPQYNFRFGYHFNSHYSLSFGFDHMKYVMVQYQTVSVSGHIDRSNTKYDGVYHRTRMPVDDDFLRFEHTNGLNYLNLEVRRMDLFHDHRLFKLNLITGAGAGILYPKTDVTFLSNDENDQWHLAGYGVSAVTGVNVEFSRYFYIQPEFKGGFIHMPDIRTTHSDTDKASQHFLFYQVNVTLGAYLNGR